MGVVKTNGIIKGNFTDVETLKILKAIDLWERAWESPQFKQWFENPFVTYTVTYGRLWWRRQEQKTVHFKMFEDCKMPPKEVYETLISKAHSTFYLHKNKLSLNPWTSAVAEASGLNITLSPKYAASALVIDLVDTLSHEFTHVLDFHHDFNYSESRNLTVPYAVGFITAEIAKTL
jgi:hypothetical protein